MQAIEMCDATWQRLLDLREGTFGPVDTGDSAYQAYAPIAGARGRFVLAQVGQSLDGRVATPSGDARDISGPDGLAHLHRCRALLDAVIVGVSTVLADDPQLSVRLVEGKNPVRVVIDCHAKLNGSESLFHDRSAPVVVFQSVKANGPELPNAEVIRLHQTQDGLAVGDILDELAARGLERILVEGGARTIARFVNAGLVDRLHVAISPIIIGAGPSGISLAPVEFLSDAHRPVTNVYNLGSDILFDCAFKAQEASQRQGQQIDMANLA